MTMRYMELPVPSGIGYCSDDSCPCGYPGAEIPRGQGYVYISKEVVDFRKNALTVEAAMGKALMEANEMEAIVVSTSGVYAPIVMCERAARRRGIDLKIAAADAQYWWKTGLVPLRPTPKASNHSRHKQKASNKAHHDTASKEKNLSDKQGVSRRLKLKHTAMLFDLVKNNDCKAIEILINEGVNINAKNDLGDTPLILAAEKGYMDIVKILLGNGADPTIVDSGGCSATYFARSRGHGDVLELLERNHTKVGTAESKDKREQEKDESDSRPKHFTSLFAAVNAKKAEAVDTLIRNGADVNAKDNLGDTPLILAAEKGCMDIVKILLDNGADPTIADNGGYSATYFAKSRGHGDVLELLERNHTKVETVGSKDKREQEKNESDSRLKHFTSLFDAVKANNAEAVDTLIKSGADVNAKNDLGDTPLILAAERGYSEIVEILLEKGADPSIEDTAGYAATYFAQTRGHRDIFNLLEQNLQSKSRLSDQKTTRRGERLVRSNHIDNITREQQEALWMQPMALFAISLGNSDTYKLSGDAITKSSVGLEVSKWAQPIVDLVVKGDELATQGRYQEAIRMYEKVLTKAPNAAIALMSIGSCYAAMGNKEEAHKWMLQARSADPKNERIAQNLQMLEMA